MARTQQRSAPVADIDIDETVDSDMDLDAAFDEDGEEMPSTNGTDNGAKDSTPRREYDDDGYQLNKKGVRDSRWKAPIWDVSTGTRLDASARTAGNGSSSGSSATGKTRAEKVQEIFGELNEDGTSVRGWQYVSVGSNPNTVKSPLGANLKDFMVIRDKDGNELTVGKGEAAKFAGVTAPRKERETTRKTQPAGGAADSEFAEAFDDAEDGATVAEGDDLDTGDELLTDDDE